MSIFTVNGLTKISLIFIYHINTTLFLSVIVHVCHFSAHTGLLTNDDADYYVSTNHERPSGVTSYQRAEVPYNRPELSLEDELDDRFGESTLAAFKREPMGPAQNIFDDV